MLFFKHRIPLQFYKNNGKEGDKMSKSTYFLLLINKWFYLFIIKTAIGPFFFNFILIGQVTSIHHIINYSPVPL